MPSNLGIYASSRKVRIWDASLLTDPVGSVINSWNDKARYDVLKTVPGLSDAVISSVSGRPAVFSSNNHVYQTVKTGGWAERVMAIAYTLQAESGSFNYFFASAVDAATCCISSAGAPLVVNRYSNSTANVYMATGNLGTLSVVVTQWTVDDATRTAYCRCVTDGTTVTTSQTFNNVSSGSVRYGPHPYVGGGAGTGIHTPDIFWHEIRMGLLDVQRTYTDDELIFTWKQLHDKWTALTV